MTKNEFERFKRFAKDMGEIRSYNLWCTLYHPIKKVSKLGYEYSTTWIRYERVQKLSNLEMIIKEDTILSYHRKHIQKINCYVTNRYETKYF